MTYAPISAGRLLAFLSGPSTLGVEALSQRRVNTHKQGIFKCVTGDYPTDCTLNSYYKVVGGFVQNTTQFILFYDYYVTSDAT